MHEVHLVRSFGALSHPKDHVNNRCGASIHEIKPRVYPWKRSTTRGFQRPDPFHWSCPGGVALFSMHRTLSVRLSRKELLA